MTDIRFEGVAKRFSDSVEVIRDLNLHIVDGELMVLVGPSGCAKSTTLRMIAGLETISDGDLWIGGERANQLSPAERNISMVFQSYALFPNMTVRGNLSFGMQIRGQARADIAGEVDRIAEMLGLTPLLDRKPRQLSGGQAQRVALGRAMIRRPAAFLFDEPLSNLDAELRVQMRGEISEMQKSLGTTTVYVTHDQVEAMTMGHRIAVMNKGAIMQVGTPIELYDAPANLFVAGFIGSPKMNFVAVTNGACLGQPLPQSVAPRSASGLTLGVRPEHVLLGTASGPDSLSLAGKVGRIEDLGHENLVHLTVPATSETLVLRAPGRARAQIRSDDTIDVTIPHSETKLFDVETGDRIR
ncbi:ABC transporter ATP-binding protein [Bauldia sp.]|uniref:ABC transporter ATP-binding protein n=1 Tax=Bauldia sp. TaxID=2575872 RepID=UPI003BA86155